MFVEEKEKYKVNEDSYIYIAINMHWEAHNFELPVLPEDKKWHIFSDTNFDRKGEEEGILLGNQQNLYVSERSIIIIIGK